MNTERDRGYAWVILFATWLNNILWTGVYTSSSVYMLAWLEEFDIGKAGIGIVGGTQNGINFLSGLFAGPLIDRYGCRNVGIVGTIITAVGLIMSSYASNIILLYVSFGLIVGTGGGWISMPAILMVQYYFDKRRPLAAGLSLMGHGLGTFIILPILHLLVEYYGWRGAMLLHSGLVLQNLLLSALYRPFDLNSIDNEDSAVVRTNTKETNLESENMITKIIAFIKTLWDFSLFKIPIYSLYTTGLVLIHCGSVLFYRFISLKAYDSGLSKMHSVLLPSIAGLSSTFSRIAFSILSNMPCVNRILQCGFGGLGQGIALFISCIAWNFYSYAAAAICFGICIGAQATVATTVMTDLMTVKRLSQANTFLSTFMGLAVLISLPLAGHVVDITGNFNLPFYIYGGTICFASMIILILPIIIKKTKRELETPTLKTVDEKKTFGKKDATNLYFSVESIHSIA